MHSLLHQISGSDQDPARVADRQPGCFAYLCLRRGLQVTQAVAQPLGGQAELAILLLDTGHTLEHHFIILSGESTLQSARTCECVRVRSATHASPFWSRKSKIDFPGTDVFILEQSLYMQPPD